MPKAKKVKAKRVTIAKSVVDVSARLFYAAALVASREETRYYLNGVHVQPCAGGGVMLVATDGHRLVCVRDSSGSCLKPVTVGFPDGFPRDLPTEKLGEEFRLRVDSAGVLSIPGAYLSSGNALIDGSYPEWARVVLPLRDAIKAGKRGLATFNSNYLHSFGKVAAKLTPKSGAPLVRIVHGETASDPALVLFPDFPDAFAVIMPVRSADLNAIPIFAKPLIELTDKKDKKEKAARLKAAKKQAGKFKALKKAA